MLSYQRPLTGLLLACFLSYGAATLLVAYSQPKPPAARAQTDPACQTPVSFKGAWDTNWGEMQIVVNGSRVTGQYTHDRGRMQGTLSSDGKTFSGTWSEAPSYKAPSDGGRFSLRLSNDGKSFSGPWGYGATLNEGTWTGQKRASAFTVSTVPCDEQKTPPTQSTAEEKEADKLFVIQNLLVNDSQFRQRQARLQEQMTEVQRNLDAQKRLLDEALQRFSQAFDAAERIKVEKLAVDQQVMAKQQEINTLANPPRVIPKKLKTLDNQRTYLEQEVEKQENRILQASSQKNTSELPRLVDTLDSLKAQLARVNDLLIQQLPPKPDNTQALATARQALKGLEDAYWEKRKAEAHALSDLQLATTTVNHSFDALDKLKEQSVDLEKQLRQLDANGSPILEKVLVVADGKNVYTAEWKGPFEELRRLETQIQETGDILKTLKTNKEAALEDFKTKAQEASDILTRLHGTNVSQGNGLWATLKDVVNNDGAILTNARRQAAVDFGMNAYEVFVEGWGKGGPAGAIVETMQKAAMFGIQSAGDSLTPLNSDNLVTRDRLLEINQKYNASLNQPASTPEILKTGLYRTIEDGLVRHGRDLANQTVGVQMVKQFARPDREQFVRMMGAPGNAKALAAQGEKLNLHRRRVLQMGKPGSYGLKDLGTSALKDAVKTALKTYFQEQENAVWEQLMLAEAAQVLLFQNYREAAENYWTAYDELEALQKQRADLVFGYNPQSGFKTVNSNPFPEKAQLTVKVGLKQPERHQERVTLGGITAQPASTHEYRLPATTLPKSNNAKPIPVDLAIQHL